MNSDPIVKAKPLVSVGIPTYNRPEGLRRTLECITGQTYKNLEIIISDNCSPGPETETVVREFMDRDNRIHYYRQEKNRGPDFNFKFVLEKATGEYFMWAADDDEWDQRFIEVCSENRNNIGTVMTNCKTLFRKTNKFNLNPDIQLSKNNSYFRNANIFLNNLCPSIIYGLHKRTTINFFLTDKPFDFYDCYFCLKQIMFNNINIIPEYLYVAGVDSDEYVIKPANPQKGRLLEYSPFFYSCIKSIIRCPNLNLFEKCYLIKTTTIVTIIHFTYFEKPYHKYLILVLNKLMGFYRQAITESKRPVNFKDQKPLREADEKKISYSQSGEDLIIKYIFDALNVKNPVYMDIGAHHPFKFSNTALFYELGSDGINIEPDPSLFSIFRKYRKRDINLNIGVSDKSGELFFYIMSLQTMNTFSKSDAEDLSLNHGITITKKIKVPVDTISNIAKTHLKGKNVDLLSVDVEGLDLQILKSIDFSEFFPTVICVETISFSTKGLGIKDLEIINFLESKGYMKYADTYINTIFVRKDRWNNH